MVEKLGQANIPKTSNIFVFYRAIGKSGNLEDQRRLHGGPPFALRKCLHSFRW